MNFTITSSWVRLGLPLSIVMLLAVIGKAQTFPQSTLVKDFQPGSSSSNPHAFTSFGSKIFFLANSSLIVSDGTDAGTSIASFVPTTYTSISVPVVMNGALYFGLNQGGLITLWKSTDGISASVLDTVWRPTTPNDVTFGEDYVYGYNNNIYISVKRDISIYTTDYATTLYRTNGQTNNLTRVGITSSSYFTSERTSSQIFQTTNTTYFISSFFGNAYSSQGVRLSINNNTPILTYTSGGNQQPTTYITALGLINEDLIIVNNDTLLKINPLGQKEILMTNLRFANKLGQMGNTIYFTCQGGFYKTDGTISGSILIVSSTLPTSDTKPYYANTPRIFNNALYLDGYTESIYGIWKIDNSMSAFKRVLNIEAPKPNLVSIIFNDKIYLAEKSGNKTTFYEPNFITNKIKLIGQLDRFDFDRYYNNNNYIGLNNTLFAAAGDDDATVVTPNAKGVELRKLSLNPSTTAFPCLGDTTRPGFYSCPTNKTFIKYNLSPSWCYFEPIPRPNAYDLCTTPITGVTAQKGTFLPEQEWRNGEPYYTYCFTGVDTVTYWARDLAYNVTKCTFAVTVTPPPSPCDVDITPPIFAACPKDTLVNSAQATIVNWTSPAITDNCGIPSVSVNFPSGSTFPVGVTNVIYTATDAKNNVATCSFNVTVGNQTPTPNCPSTSQAPWNEWIKEVRLGTFVNASDKIRTDRYAVGYSDFTDKLISVNKGQNYPLSISNGLSWSGAQVNLFYRVWIDYNKNNIFEDTEKVFESTAVSLPANGSILIPTTATVGSTRMRVSMKKDAYSTACETFVAGEVEDYTVQIEDTTTNPCVNDVIPPVFSNCPANISLTTTGTTAIATWTAPTATDNCTVTPSVSSTYNAGFAFPIGTTTVTYTAKDALNNATICSFTVTVTQQTTGGDICTNSAASVSTGANTITVAGITTSAAIIQIFTTGWIPVYNQQVSGTSVTIPNITAGTYVVKVTKLGTGGTWPAVCTVQINNVVVGTGTNPCATDNIAPVFANCPANISLTTTGTTAIGTWTVPTATDNCTATPSVSSNFASGFAFPIGTTTVIYTAKDNLNNAKTCSFTVTVTTQTTGGGANDIGLTLSSSPSTYRQWTPITVRVSAKNNGTTAMNNVKIELKRPTKTSSGGAKIPSLGTFNDYCAGGIECSEWVIPSLAAGATATLDAPFFVLDATLPIVVTTTLLASTPTNATTANNTASISIAPQTAVATPAIAQLAYQKPTQLIPIVVQRIAPNPTAGALIVKLESLDEREVVFEFFNTLGKLVKTEKRAVDKGVNRVEFEVYDLEQGVHFIVPSTTQGYKVPTKFVKM
jgi:hypothetical protein